MKNSGRKTSSAYELYGFIPRVEKGKHSAICIACNRVLQNSAAIRLQKHRNSCIAANAAGTDPAQFLSLELKRHITPNTDTAQQDENIISNIKTELSNMEYEDTNINDNANDNTTYEDTAERHITPNTDTAQQDENIISNIKTEQSNLEFEDTNINDIANDNTTYEDTVEVTMNRSKRARKSSIQDEIQNTSDNSDKTQEVTTNRSKRARKSSIQDEIQNTSHNSDKTQEPITNSNSEVNAIKSSTTTNSHQPQRPQKQYQQPSETFEPFHPTTADTTNTNTSIALDVDDDDIEEINDEYLLNIEEELNVIQNLMPRSKESQKLQDDLAKAETEYYRIKAAYFTKLIENCKIKRTLMLLESRKLQLEIEKLTNES